MKIFKNIIFVVCLLISSTYARADSPMKVTATLTSFADLAKTIGGEWVEVKSIASPKFNPHFIEARPSDVLKVKNADLFIHAGLDLEAWRGPLVDAAARSDIRSGGEHQLDLSQGISLLEVPGGPISRAEGDIHMFGNPHYWLDPRNAAIMAKAIALKLSELDPSHQATFNENLRVFNEKLESKMSEWQKLLAPFNGQELIGYHNEWVYLMSFSNLKMLQFLEPKPGIPPTPKQLEFLVEYITQKKIKGIVQATFYTREAGDTVASRSGAKLLLLCQNVGELSEASDYIAMIDYNVSQIVGALSHD